jgi:hypothetical protein
MSVHSLGKGEAIVPTRTVPPGELERELSSRLAATPPRRTPGGRRSRSRGRARVRFAGLLGVISLMVLGISGALAVHDAGIIELDGNLANDSGNPPFTDGVDWAHFQDANGDIIAANLPPGTIEGAVTGVIQDFVIGEPGADDPSYHEPSNHDQQGIDPTGSGTWGCVTASNPTDKNDIINAYALAAVKNDDTYFYFGVERYDNSGTAFIGVWLFQDDVSCDTDLEKFVGEKKTGDILILTNFTNGGVITTLQAYQFTAGATPADPGTFTLIGSSVDCDVAPADDFLCGNVNTTNVTTPWAFEDKDKPGPPNPDPNNVMEISEFFEGGINLTDAFAAADLDVPECFGSFLAETRSSDVLEGATLKDYALGDFNTCNARISIAQSETNLVGDAHTFTVTVEKKSLSTGGDWVAAPGATVTPSETGVGTIDLAASLIVVDSDSTGTSTVHAAASVPVGNSTLEVATNGTGAHTVSNVKTWVDAQISIGTSGTNKVGDAHTFTVTVEKDAGDGSGFVPAAGVNVDASSTGVGSITGGTCDNTGGDTNASGQCTIVVDSDATGQATVDASATVSVGGLNVDVATDGYGSNDVSNIKTWVDAQITIETSGTNKVGDPHTFTVTVEKDAGDGLGFVPAAGVNVLASESGDGSITGGTCDNTGGDTDASGQCTIVVNSSVAGTSTVDASATVSVGGINVAVATDGYGAHDISNTKNWVDASITIETDATNEVGDPHTFTVTVTKDEGNGAEPVTDGNVDVTLTDSNGASNAIDATASTCDDNQPDGDNLDANGQCIVVFSSEVAGLVTGHASASITVGGIAFSISTDGSGDNSDDAEKTFVDASITVETDATNEVGDAHTFTVTVYEDAGDGNGFVGADGEAVTITFPNGAPGTVDDSDCAATHDGGICYVVVNSAVPGAFDIHAASNVQVGGLSLARETDGTGDNSDDATKTYVDAYITIDPDGTNGITEAHTFTVYVAENDGSGWADAAGEIVTITFPGGAPGTVDDSDCADGTAADGTCVVIINSSVAGTFNAHAAADVSVGGITVSVETDGTGSNSDDAVKEYVDGSLTWLKHDNNGQLLGGATFEVCRTLDRFGTDIVDECVTIVDDVDGVDDLVGDQDGTPGEFKLDGLLLGTYTIEETVAPPTYTLDTFVETIVLTIDTPDLAATHIWVNTPSGEGCTPGYWKNHTAAWNSFTDATVDAMPAGYEFTTTTLFNDYFDLTPAQSGFNNNVTMLSAVKAGGGGEKALARHGVSALLNVAALDGYPIQDFIDLYNDIRDAYLNNTETALANILAGYNNLDHQNCPTS